LVGAVVAGLVVYGLIQRSIAQQHQRQAASNGMAASALSYLDTNPELSVLLARTAVQRDPTPQADVALRRAVGADPLRATLRHQGPVRWVDFSPDGRLAVTASDDHTAGLWDTRTGHELHVLHHNGAVNFAAFSRDGRLVVSASADATARVWQTANGQSVGPAMRAPPGLPGLVRAFLTPDGKRVVGGGSDGALRVWDVASGKLVATLGSPNGPVLTDVALSPDGRLAIAGDPNGGVRIWNLRTRKAVVLRGHRLGSAINRVAFSPNGRLAAAGSDDATARVWTIKGRRLYVFPGDPTTTLQGFKFIDGIEDLAFSPNGKYLVTAGIARGTARVWDLHRGRLIATLPGSGSAYAVRFSPDSKLVVTAGVDPKTRVWDTRSGLPVTSFAGQAGTIVLGVAFNHDGTRIATASTDGAARVWETYPGRLLATFAPSGDLAALPTPDGRSVITASSDGTVAAWDSTTGRQLLQTRAGQPLIDAQLSRDGRSLLLVTGRGLRVVDAATLGHRHSVTLADPGLHVPYTFGASAINRDGTRAICGTADGHAVLWNAVTGQLLGVLKPIPGPHTTGSVTVGATAISADGSRVAAVAIPTDIQQDWATVWDAHGRQLGVIRPRAPIAGAVFSPDATKIATFGTNRPGGGTGPAVWDALSAKRIFALHDNFGVLSGGFSTDGHSLVTAGIGGTIELWNIASGRGMPLPRGRAEAADYAQFSPDDRLIIFGAADGTARAFDVRSGLEVATLAGPSQPILLAQFSSLEGPVMSVDASGAISMYACDVCGPISHVEQAAKSLVPRGLTPAERARYLQGL
jgi:WD40 repeat protein